MASKLHTNPNNTVWRPTDFALPEIYLVLLPQ